MANSGSEPVKFSEVLAAELNVVKASRDRRGELRPVEPLPSDGSKSSEARASDSNLLGLTFSGGGIRSATFNLGVLQGLAKLNLLKKFDYLSTVSGGGYIGSWLTAWIARCGMKDVLLGLQREAEKKDQKGNAAGTKARREEPREISHLRDFSNYLTPKLGFFSGDTWVAITVYLRNFLLNFLILFLALAGVLLLPRLLVCLSGALQECPRTTLVLAIIASAVALIQIFRFLLALSTPAVTEAARQWQRQANVLGWICPFAILAAYLFTCILSKSTIWQVAQLSYSEAPWRAITFVPPILLLLAIFFGGLVVGSLGLLVSDYRREWTARLGGWMMLFALIWVGVFGLALYGPRLVMYLNFWVRTATGAAILGYLLKSVLAAKGGETGAPGANQWLDRAISLSPYVLILVLLLSVAFVMHLGLPYVVGMDNATANVKNFLHAPAKCPPTENQSLQLKLDAARSSGRVSDTNAGENQEIAIRVDASSSNTAGCVDLVTADWTLLSAVCKPDAAAVRTTWVMILFFLLAGFLSGRVDINEFSMHGFYRNRLVRCYLGASNWARSPQPFTGFDPKDDLKFCDITPGDGKGEPAKKAFDGPYPIINTALNLVDAEKLAWQQRKAASFAFTPLYCGYAEPGKDTEGQCRGGVLDHLVSEPVKPNGKNIFRSSAKYGEGVKLGTAVAISGAAASPNMGYHSTPAMAFLLTVFNVRLGWWLGNPDNERTWEERGPRSGLYYHLVELLGGTNDELPYVYLSDGGHFENLGIYELVRRRCRYIVACDAGADPDLKFEDLGNAIEKCRTDFGIRIKMKALREFQRDKDRRESEWHCAVGTIHYEDVDETASSGTLVLLKASLTGDEPADVQSYASTRAEFPHETTADQWFDETQFESYRSLGQHIVEEVFGAIGDADDLDQEEPAGLFQHLGERWYPPSKAIQQSFTKHSAAYDRIIERIRTEDRLKFLDAQIFPEWPSLMNGLRRPLDVELWLPDSEDERREGFYLCNQMIQLMENVYLDLNLEEEFNHPDNRGWMNLFQHWAWSGMFCATYAISACTFGARFQKWCGRRLDLRLGEVMVDGWTVKGPVKGPVEPPIEMDLPVLETEAKKKEARSKFEEDIATAKKEGRLNFWEVMLILEYVKRMAGGPDVHLRVYPLEMRVMNPERDGRKLQFTFGFVILRIYKAGGARLKDVAEVAHFRVQNHLRKLGLAREALQILKGFSTPPVQMPDWTDKMEDEVKRALESPDELPEGMREALPTEKGWRELKQWFESLPQPKK